MKDEPSAGTETTTRADDGEQGRSLLVCAECGRRITSAAARTEVAGSHSHTKVNPSGLVFQIGCFAHAVGCRRLGGPSPEWSWFAGYVWTMEVCANCRTHLGWLFESAGRAFHAFVLDRLIEQDEESPPPR